MKEEKEKKEQSTEMARLETEPLLHLTPFGFMRRFAGDMERLFGDFEGFRFPNLFGRELFPLRREFEKVAWMPEIEVLQKGGQFTVRVDLPGLKKDDVKVEVTSDLLRISGERKEEKEEKREGYFRSERSYGSFFRQIPLPEGAKTDTTTANFTDGVLEISLQTPEREPVSREVEIKQGVETAKAKAAVK